MSTSILPRKFSDRLDKLLIVRLHYYLPKPVSSNSRNLRIPQVSADLLADFDARIAALPVKPPPIKTKLSLRELVGEIYNSIMGLKAKGYSADDICELISKDLAVSIAPGTLNSYLRQEGKKRKQQQRQQQRKQRLAQPSARPLAELPPAQTVPLEVPLSSQSGITMDVEFAVVDRAEPNS